MINFWVYFGVFCIDVAFLALLFLGRGKLEWNAQSVVEPDRVRWSVILVGKQQIDLLEMALVP